MIEIRGQSPLYVVSYGLESKSVTYVALSSFACVLDATYAFMLGNHPFVIAKIIRAVIAFKQY